jgi:hypothetical protein
MNIFVVIEEKENDCLLLCADADEETAIKQRDYFSSILTGNVRIAEIELTNKRLGFKSVLVDSNELEHLLNCMDNQKFIHEQNEETQKEWQEIIDKANRNMRRVWLNQSIN